LVSDVIQAGRVITVETMSDNTGTKFKTGEKCTISGSYVFDGYTSGPSSPQPTQEERVIPLTRNETFPPIRSTERGAWWKLQRAT